MSELPTLSVRLPEKGIAIMQRGQGGITYRFTR